jgi:hypothetical protein
MIGERGSERSGTHSDEHGGHPSDAHLLLALDGELDAPEAARVSDHLRGCAACRATSDQLAAMSRDVERYCRSWPPEAAAVASAMPTRAVPPWQRSWRERILSRSAVLATAAAVLLAIGAGAMWIKLSSGARTIAPQAAVIPILPTPPPTRASDIQLASANTNTPIARATPIAAHPRPAAVTRTAARAAAAQRTPTYYWSLPYSNHALPLSEGAVIMNVRLSREQLRLAGIPVSDVHIATDRNQDLVRAKVLVGADGLPRAISFDQN